MTDEHHKKGAPRLTTADRVRQWYANRTPEQVEADVEVGREFALEMQRHTAGVSKAKDELAARRVRRAARSHDQPPVLVQGDRCARCSREMPTTAATGWEDVATEEDPSDVWVCPDCLTPVEEAVVEQDAADLMEIGGHIRGAADDDGSQ